MGRVGALSARPVSEVELAGVDAVRTGIDEVDRVLGGGLVPGSVTLLGGEPGIGKSTLALQLAARWTEGGRQALYVSAEESAAQVGGRARRLGAVPEGLWLAAVHQVEGVVAEASAVSADLVVVDSVQTMQTPAGSAGPVAQVREVTRQLIEAAKGRDLAVVMIGQVTKEGELAGPKTLEHLVDTVLAFDGDRHHNLRFLRAVKHRFGATGEVGLFEMCATGLEPVADPSALFLTDRVTGVPGSVVMPVLEGGRPLLVEAQALVSPRVMAQPRRTAQGLDHGRVAMLAAVLEQRARVALHEHDIHTSTVGGVRVVEPAADLGVLLAMASARLDRPVPDDLVACGEVGLVGEVRRVADLERRLREARRLGFRRAVVPASAAVEVPGLDIVGVGHVIEALQVLTSLRSVSSTAA